MNFMYLRFWLYFGFACSFSCLAASIDTQVSPRSSTNGELIRFKVIVSSDQDKSIGQAQIAKLGFWDVVNVYQSRGLESRYINGKMSIQSTGEFTYVLEAKKEGLIKTPLIKVKVGNKVLESPRKTVKVSQLPPAGKRSRQQRRRVKPPSGSFGFNFSLPGFDDQEEESLQKKENNAKSDKVTLSPKGLPTNKSIFLWGHPSKTSVYEGELIVLSYYLYSRSSRITHREFAKFPSFKGFLKEELHTTPTRNLEEIRIGDHTYMRQELSRFALFPIKTGKLNVDSFHFRVGAAMDPRDLIDQFFTGRRNLGGFFNRMQNKIYDLKSPILNIKSLPLPAVPEGKIFNGSVGNFNMELINPPKKVQVDQPFTINLKISGSGNIKSMKAPKLNLPADAIEVFDVKSSYEFKKDASGFKNFEYLLLAKKAGNYNFPGISWTYFNPSEERYKSLTSKEIQITAFGESQKSKESLVKNQEKPKELSGLYALDESQLSSKLKNAHNFFIGQPLAYILQFLFALILLGLYLKKKKQLALKADYAQFPWKKTTKEILASSNKEAHKLSEKLDLWMRQKLASELYQHGDQSIHPEASRDQFIVSFKKICPSMSKSSFDKIKQRWNELDQMRFLKEKDVSKVSCSKELKRCEKVCDDLINIFNQLRKKGD